MSAMSTKTPGGSAANTNGSASSLQTNIAELDSIQQDVAEWHMKQSAQLKATHAKFSAQIRSLEEIIRSSGYPTSTSTNGGGGGDYKSVGGGTPIRPGSSATKPTGLDWDQLTPSRQTGGNMDDLSPSMASPPVSHPLSFETLIEEVQRDQVRKAQMTGGPTRYSDGLSSARPVNDNVPNKHIRPTPDSLSQEVLNAPSPTNRNTPCQVLVEFKRRRVLQFESPHYVAPGEYVVVGGDRGEDIGLVTHTWASGTSSTAPESVAKWAGVGLGKVLRVATVLEVSQLQGVQTELEARAVEVAQEKVVEHGLHMRIVDAEYQFDRKKLTFYYQSQSRLDFRTLVRDLYKTFRARIWMEQD